ncbi:hypothetical protein F3Y22_tig00111402pilonHSYRG00516 [Hibiscus syriacus]|uniref:Uncharacterized protein n=1 Tax=Hibiscus syriacus TaxID=106335 RepID=A0A6A2Y9J6_HIBSY|nr:hypothetical protein F3Y22_tig00111402pilonHSYRG00516 [Hibiscus syriacus]
MVKEDWLLELEGKILSGEVERPVGESKVLGVGEVKLDFRWLAMGEAAAMSNSRICHQEK